MSISVLRHRTPFSLAAAPARRPAVVAAKVPPLVAYDKVRRYSKDGKTFYGYTHFPKNIITADQIRAHVTPHKNCWGCGETKNSSNFHIQRQSPDGLHNKCVECRKIRKRKKRYNISEPQYAQLGAKQDEKCAIYKMEFHGIRVVIDHDHVTEHVRGLLCDRCNRGLGHFVDSIESLKGAIVYLTHDYSLGIKATLFDSVISLAAAPARRPAVVAAEVPPLVAYDKVPRYSKDGKTVYRGYIHFPKNIITADQIRAHVTPHKKCWGCGETKNSSNFHIYRHVADGLNNKCVECCKIRWRGGLTNE
jgi:hypothetical protein